MYHHRECTQFIGHCLIHLDLGRITEIILIQKELDSSKYIKIVFIAKTLHYCRDAYQARQIMQDCLDFTF